MVLPKSSNARKKQVVTGRLESYHRGYLLGYRCGNKQSKAKGKEPKRKARKVKSISSIQARLDAYQRGYQLGMRSGTQQEHAQQQEEKRRYQKVQKGRNIKRGQQWSKRLESARREAYMEGLRCGTRRKQAKDSTLRIQRASKRKAD